MTEGEAAPATAAEQGSRNLLLRTIVAIVLAPTALAMAYAGGVLWAMLVTAASVGLFVEWLLVVGALHDRRVATIGSVALSLSGVGFAAGRIDAALAVLVLGGAATAWFSRPHWSWNAAGFGYAAAAEIAAIAVRLDRGYGFVALVLILLVVWVTDIGGYFAGRGIGGAKLWPRISPKKTWAGAIGGFVASLAVAAGFAALGVGQPLALVLLSGLMSIVSQLGDLFESAVKRRFGVKDSSHLIPGHGGLLDRLDGLVAALVLAAILGFFRGGVDGVGRGLMVW